MADTVELRGPHKHEDRIEEPFWSPDQDEMREAVDLILGEDNDGSDFNTSVFMDVVHRVSFMTEDELPFMLDGSFMARTEQVFHLYHSTLAQQAAEMGEEA